MLIIMLLGKCTSKLTRYYLNAHQDDYDKKGGQLQVVTRLWKSWKLVHDWWVCKVVQMLGKHFCGSPKD